MDATPSARALVQRLQALSPREASLLRRWVLRAEPAHAIAFWLGIAPEAAEVALLRAAQAMAGQPLALGAGPEERALAEVLVRAWETDTAPRPPGLHAAWDALLALRRVAPAIEALEQARARDAAARDRWLRWAMAGALIALGFLLGWR